MPNRGLSRLCVPRSHAGADVGDGRDEYGPITHDQLEAQGSGCDRGRGLGGQCRGGPVESVGGWMGRTPMGSITPPPEAEPPVAVADDYQQRLERLLVVPESVPSGIATAVRAGTNRKESNVEVEDVER